MIPLRDENPTLRTPYITVLLIALNVVAWLYIEGAGVSPGLLAQSVCRFGMIPAEVTGRTGGFGGVVLGGAPCPFGGLTWAAILTSMFMHGSWMHLIGNMWFLWLFGNNVEDSMGRLRYLVFYLLVGVVAALAQVYSGPASPIPTVGASGAISGVMGAYLVLYPRVRVQTLFWIVIFVRIIPIPAWFILGEWFVIQLLSARGGPSMGGGVAFWAHVGGFITGAALVKLFENPELVELRQRTFTPRPPDSYGW